MTIQATLTAGTRGSALARVQTELVRSSLLRAHALIDGIDVVSIATTGDRTVDQPLAALGGKGAFTAELEQALVEGRIDIAVHSLKDLPTSIPEGLCIGAILERADARDALVTRTGGATLDTLPRGARVGTSSPRRTVQLRILRPDLQLRDIRGNVDTRLRKLDAGDYDALVLASAGLARLGLEQRIDERIDTERIVPAPGQGALAVQCRSDDHDVRTLLVALEHIPTRLGVTAERQFLALLGGGCAAPIAAHASVDGAGGLAMTAFVASADGDSHIRVHGRGSDVEELAQRLATESMAAGAHSMLRGR
jgi:hydroxymethylbilane synthase